MEPITELEYSAKENREYKDSVFVDLFFQDESAIDNELALFNALHDTHYTKDEIKIDRIRVDQTLYMNFKNDVSYKAGGKFLIFAEHQSTINPNMCIRSLMYAGRAYEQMVPIKSRYSTY